MPTNSENTSSAKSVVVDGVTYYAKLHHTYVISATRHILNASLIDRGANGGICGEDVRVISSSKRTVNIQGIDNHTISNVPIVSAGGVVDTQHGPVILVMHQYAHVGKGNTIHSAGQLEFFGNDVNDKSVKISGGTQRIMTLDGYLIPLDIINGLPYLKIRPYTDSELKKLPMVVVTSDDCWDTMVLDYRYSDKDNWHDDIKFL